MRTAQALLLSSFSIPSRPLLSLSLSLQSPASPFFRKKREGGWVRGAVVLRREARCLLLAPSTFPPFDAQGHAIAAQPAKTSTIFSHCKRHSHSQRPLRRSHLRSTLASISTTTNHGAQKNHPLRGGFFGGENESSGPWLARLNLLSLINSRMFYLASSYFLRGLPPKYRRR